MWKDFRTEVLWDTRVVNWQNYSGSTGPVGVEADGEISCFSDGAGREKGWSIYADISPAPTPPPTPSFTSHIVVSDGECDVVGYCVHSPKIIHQIMDQIRHVTFVSEVMARFLWTISPQRTRWTTCFWLVTRTLN